MNAVELLPGHVSRLGLGVLPAADVMAYTGLELLPRLIAGTTASARNRNRFR